MAFQNCKDPNNTDVVDKTRCWDKKTLKEWSDKYDLKMSYMSTFAWVDLAEPVEYFKQTIT